MKSSLFVFFGCFCCHTEETITIPSLQMFVQGFHFSVALLLSPLLERVHPDVNAYLPSLLSKYPSLLLLLLFITQLCPALCDPWTAAHQASLSFTISRSLLKLLSIESAMPSNHLVFCRPPPSYFGVPASHIWSSILDELRFL